MGEDKDDPYKAAGVNYAAMDPFKRACMEAALATAEHLRGLSMTELAWTRGESAYVVMLSSGDHLGMVIEGLGTKSCVADALYALTGRVFDDRVALCNAAMVLNDLATLGADPAVFLLKVDAGDDAWFENEARVSAFIRGTRSACDQVGCSWGGGETATLPDVVVPGALVFSGSAFGPIARERDIINPKRIHEGDRIILLGSSGPHANGFSLARRKMNLQLPGDYLKSLPDGTAYGEALLAPTFLYGPTLTALRRAGIQICYAMNVTGHGWRKLMRAVYDHTYVIERIPEPQPVFDFIQSHGVNADGSVGLSDEKMYGTFNMGAGFALIVPPDDAERAVEIAQGCGVPALDAGFVEVGPRRVVIRPKNLIFEGSTLAVR
jgi:phosphoribosylformylglycinamidine cyclo-ligase